MALQAAPKGDGGTKVRGISGSGGDEGAFPTSLGEKSPRRDLKEGKSFSIGEPVGRVGRPYFTGRPRGAFCAYISGQKQIRDSRKKLRLEKNISRAILSRSLPKKTRGLMAHFLRFGLGLCRTEERNNLFWTTKNRIGTIKACSGRARAKISQASTRGQPLAGKLGGGARAALRPNGSLDIRWRTGRTVRGGALRVYNKDGGNGVGRPGRFAGRIYPS